MHVRAGRPAFARPYVGVHIMMLYKNTKVKVRSPDGDTDFFDIVAGFLQGESLISVHNLPRLRTLNVDISNERKWLYTKQEQEANDTMNKLLRTQTRASCKYTNPS